MGIILGQSPPWIDDPATGTIVLCTLAAVTCCLALHAGLVVHVGRLISASGRGLIARCLMTGGLLLVAHLLSVVLFALAHISAENISGENVGVLIGEEPVRLIDRFYFSAVVYSSLGLGDLRPVGPLRILVAVEGITGLVLLAWSASLGYAALTSKPRGSASHRSEAQGVSRP